MQRQLMLCALLGYSMRTYRSDPCKRFRKIESLVPNMLEALRVIPKSNICWAKWALRCTPNITIRLLAFARPDSLIHVYFADFPLPVLYIPSLCFNVIPNVLCLPYSSFIRNLMWLPHPTLSPAAAAGGSRGRSSAVPLPCPTPIILLGTQPSAVCICIYII